MWQAFLIVIWQLSAILLLTSSPLKLCQVGWGQTHIFRFLQKYLIEFKLRLWLGHSRTFTDLSISHSCCVCRSIVLLEGKPSAQSKVRNALDWVFIKAQYQHSSQYFGALSFSSTLTFQSVPATEKAPQHEAATSTLYLWDGTLHVMSRAWFPSNRMLGIEVHQTREYYFSQSEGPLGAFFFANSKCVFMCLHWREDWDLPHRHKAQIDEVSQWCLSFCRFLLSPHMIMELN